MSYISLGIPDDVFALPVAIYEKQYDCKVTGRRYIVDECFVRIFESSRRDFPARDFYNISQYKMAGLLCFWIRKLKPFSVPEKEEANRFVNETIALYSALYLVLGYGINAGERPCLNLDGNYIHDLIVSLRYNSFSPHSTAYLFESLFR